MGYTNTDIRKAILAAADHIEAHPNAFDVMATRLPTCGTPGCALGWISYFLGGLESDGGHGCFPCIPILGHSSDSEFYNALFRLRGTAWMVSAKDCAKALRLYADRYYSEHPKPDLMTLFAPEFAGPRAGLEATES